MKQKKKDKYLANATAKWEKQQLQAAVAAEQLDKALAVIEQYKDELTEKQLEDVVAQTNKKKAELEEFLMKARDTYAKKLADLNVEAVFAKEKPASIVNLEDINA